MVLLVLYPVSGVVEDDNYIVKRTLDNYALIHYTLRIHSLVGLMTQLYI